MAETTPPLSFIFLMVHPLPTCPYLTQIIHEIATGMQLPEKLANFAILSEARNV
jgi:hypothetical protein